VWTNLADTKDRTDAWSLSTGPSLHGATSDPLSAPQRAARSRRASVIRVVRGACRGSEASEYSSLATMARAPAGIGTLNRSVRESRGLMRVSRPTEAALRNRSGTVLRMLPRASFSSLR
jgi:hypothetical protein